MTATQQITLYDSLRTKYQLDSTTAQDLIVKVQFILDEIPEKTNSSVATKEDIQQLKADITREIKWEQSDRLFYIALSAFLCLLFFLDILITFKK